MYYRLATQPAASACWEWESRVIASVEILFRVLWMYRSEPWDRLRVFFSSSVAGLDLMREREDQGLASTSIPLAHLLHERWSTPQSISQLEMRQFESALRTRESELATLFAASSRLDDPAGEGAAGRTAPLGRTRERHSNSLAKMAS